MASALFLHHDANSMVGLLGPALAHEGYEIRQHFICADLDSGVAAGPLPTLEGVDLLVLLGSRWSVYDTDNIGTWIDDELGLVRSADDAAIPVLGICFGGQVLAQALGGSVSAAGSEEIGWVGVELTDAAYDTPDGEPVFDSGPWFQWHLDVFEVPPDGELLATSPAGPQAFRLRRNLALQFHPEVNNAVLEDWMITDRDQLADCGIDPDSLVAQTAIQAPQATVRAATLVRNFLASLHVS